MMPSRKLLIIKTSSLGDVVHMLPAMTDVHTVLPDVQVDWVVEESFADVPSWHPGVRRILPVALRRWRKQPFQAQTRREIRAFIHAVRQERYDWVLDSQGLLKSAVLGCFASGRRYGYDWHSIREPLASIAYQQRMAVSRQCHAITRNRLLTAQSLGYDIDQLPLDYGIARTVFPRLPVTLPEPYVVALHGTSRVYKEWDETQWQALLSALAQQGCHTLLPWGNQREDERANRLARDNAFVRVLPRCSLGELAGILQNAQAVVGMDTGLMHLAAALDKPGVALYPATIPALTGVLGNADAAAGIQTIGGAATGDTALVIQHLQKYL